jgi:carboxyl-terminal processing protease
MAALDRRCRWKRLANLFFANRRQAVALLVISLIAGLLYWLITPVLAQAPQMAVFEQVWQTVNDRFYDPRFNGVDWQAIRTRYAPQVKQAQSREEFATVINQMLAELKTSHMRYYTPDEPAYYQLLGIFQPRSEELRKQLKDSFPNGKIEYTGIGITTKTIEGKTFVNAIFDNSPAAQAGLKVGDEILGIEQQPFHPVRSFEGKAGQKLSLQIQRSPDPASRQTLMITPRRYDAKSMFLEAQRASTRLIERNGKKIGYVHIWSCAHEDYQDALEEAILYDRLSQADALILDLREGWGGSPATVLNFYTGRSPSMTSIARDGTRYTRNSSWKKPVVMLVNEGSRSAKEILAYGFQQYQVGTLVGTPTAGAVVAGRPYLMQDGSLLYVAIADVFVDGNQRLEGKGVTPDIVVPRPLPYAQGADPQQDKAIEVAAAAVKGRS